jgi:hypothetical protein
MNVNNNKKTSFKIGDLRALTLCFDIMMSSEHTIGNAANTLRTKVPDIVSLCWKNEYVCAQTGN